MLSLTRYSEQFSEEEFFLLSDIMPIARRLSGYSGALYLEKGDNNEIFAADTHAWTTWSPFAFWRIPTIKVFPCLIEEGMDAVGVCMTHELIHCRQGFWKVYGQKFLWMLMFWKSGEPPVEQEAYESVNLWYDNQFEQP